MQLMAYGQFAFHLGTLAYQELERAAEWRHPSTPRVGARPASQYTGPGAETITLDGTLYPGQTGTPDSLALLRQMADTGQAWPLVAGTGAVFGAYVITSIREQHSELMADGTPRRIQFTLSLQRVDDGATDQLGTQTTVVG